MNNISNKKLYENIMRDVSNTVKKHINEDGYETINDEYRDMFLEMSKVPTGKKSEITKKYLSTNKDRARYIIKQFISNYLNNIKLDSVYMRLILSGKVLNIKSYKECSPIIDDYINAGKTDIKIQFIPKVSRKIGDIIYAIYQSIKKYNEKILCNIVINDKGVFININPQNVETIKDFVEYFYTVDKFLFDLYKNS